MQLKAQSAIEYLTTYGWAILIVGVVLAALFSLGVFSPSTFTGQECLLPAGLSCTNLNLASNGLLTINILQVTQSPINVTAIGCSANQTMVSMQKPYNPPSNQIFMPIGSNYTFTTFCYAGSAIYSGKPGSLFNGYLIINYTSTTTGFPHIAIGQIVARVT
jgi:hypothetical protein